MFTPLAVLPAILLALAPAAPRMPASKPSARATKVLGTLTIPRMMCAQNRLRLGDSCVSQAAIRALGSGIVTDVGSCKLQYKDATANCDVYFTEVVDEKTAYHRSTLKMVTWFLTGKTCSGKEGCLKGRQVGAKYVTQLVLDGPKGTWSGDMTLYTWFQKRRTKGALPDPTLRFMKSGTGQFGSNSIRAFEESRTADARPMRRTARALPLYRSATGTTTFLQDLCKEVVDEVTDGAGEAAGDVTGGLVQSGINKVAGNLTKAALEKGPVGWIAAPFIFLGGKGLAHLGGGITSIVTKSAVKTAGKRWKFDSVCDEFADPDPNPDPGPGPGGGPTPPPPPDPNDPQAPPTVACMHCNSYGVESIHVPGEWSTGADGVEYLKVYADRHEVVCTDWNTSQGTDSNFDSFCD